MVALARQRPLLLLAEDVHWADPSSLELLDGVIEQLSDLPVLLIVSFRPEFAPPWVGRANATHITLSRLGRRDAERLATEVTIGRALPPALLDRIVARSDGVPLFIEELTKSVVESGADDPTVLPSMAVPESLQALADRAARQAAGGETRGADRGRHWARIHSVAARRGRPGSAASNLPPGWTSWSVPAWRRVAAN